LDTVAIRTKGTQNGALRHIHTLLFQLFLPHEPIASATFDNVYTDSGTGNTNALCRYQRVVEDIYTHSSHWRRAGSTAGVFVHAQFQLCLVAVSCCHCIGNSRLEPHYIATTHAYAGYGRIFLRHYQRIFYNHINIETKNKNKDI
jgi:hypothetical protein